jgi:hypothetical protein
LKGGVGGSEVRRAKMQADGLIGGEPPVPDGLDRLRDKVNALDSKRKVNGDENKFKAMSLRHICGLKGQESPGFSRL